MPLSIKKLPEIQEAFFTASKLPTQNREPATVMNICFLILKLLMLLRVFYHHSNL